MEQQNNQSQKECHFQKTIVHRLNVMQVLRQDASCLGSANEWLTSYTRVAPPRTMHHSPPPLPPPLPTRRVRSQFHSAWLAWGMVTFKFWNTQEEQHGVKQHGEENIQKKDIPGHHNGLCSIPVHLWYTTLQSMAPLQNLQNTFQRIEPENSGVSEHAVFYQYWRRMALPSTECAHGCG